MTKTEAAAVVLDAQGLDALIAALADEGREVHGPVRRDGAIVYEPIDSTEDLPRGWIDEQDGGRYRLHKEGDAFFGVTVGPSSWKRVLHPPKQTLWRTDKEDGVPQIRPEPPDDKRYAFVGVRACDLAAIAIQDKVFMGGPFRDPHYAARRADLFIVAANCGRSASTCFCNSMETGPRARAGFDIALTEIDEGHAFLAEAGSEAGAALLARLPSRPARPQDHHAADDLEARAISQQTRRIDRDGLPELLKSNPNHARWDDVASRCLNCANCTMVCPTCFCTTVDDLSNVDGSETAREQRWASCFTMDFTYVHGGPVRPSAKSRYRQWMTHKLATWHDQFGSSGCVGCGRCISWCPVGIDITEEAAAIRGSSEGG
jgi:ferredoxin